LLAVSCWLISWLSLRSRRWRHYVRPKRRLTFIGLHGVIAHKPPLRERQINTYYQVDELKEDEMSRTCSRQGRDEEKRNS
jgi:hypothetical protein